MEHSSLGQVAQNCLKIFLFSFYVLNNEVGILHLVLLLSMWAATEHSSDLPNSKITSGQAGDCLFLHYNSSRGTPNLL